MLRRTLGAPFLVAALVPLGGSGCFSFHARASETHETVHPLAPGGRLHLQGQNGRIDVQPGGGSEVRLLWTATCRAHTQEAAAEGAALIQPVVSVAEGLVDIRFDLPPSLWRSYQVDLRAWVPPQTDLSLVNSNGLITVEAIEGRLEARTSNGRVIAHDSGGGSVLLSTSNGDIVADRLRGSLEASTRNGSIRLRECAGPIEARTSNGRVEVDASTGLAGALTVETSNGHIRCLFPAGFSADLDARTSNSGIRCDFPLDGGQVVRGKGRARGRIGRGGPLVRLSTSNGSVEVRRSGAAVEAPPPARPAGEEAAVEGGSRRI